jgi:hypothetical protein
MHAETVPELPFPRDGRGTGTNGKFPSAAEARQTKPLASPGHQGMMWWGLFFPAGNVFGGTGLGAVDRFERGRSCVPLSFPSPHCRHLRFGRRSFFSRPTTLMLVAVLWIPVWETGAVPEPVFCSQVDVANGDDGSGRVRRTFVCLVLTIL